MCVSLDSCCRKECGVCGGNVCVTGKHCGAVSTGVPLGAICHRLVDQTGGAQFLHLVIKSREVCFNRFKI